MDNIFFEKLLAAIRQPIVIEGQSIYLTVSLGVTLYPRDHVQGDILLRHANQAMYRAKQRGRDTYHFFDPDQDRLLQVRHEQRQRFIDALNRDELRLYFQPQVDMRSGQVIGVEALIRWQHPEQGLLAPGQFLSTIDTTSLEIDLGEWVLTQALNQLTQWQAQGISITISVNISPTHLLISDFSQRLGELLKRYSHVPPKMLKLEVLESAAMHDITAALKNIACCQSLGVGFAIDDFGTGFSSLTHLRQLPVDLIKIDRSFVRDMLTDPNDMAIVESVIYMANRFDRAMLAEGVETLDHAKALMKLGCFLAQRIWNRQAHARRGNTRLAYPMAESNRLAGADASFVSGHIKPLGRQPFQARGHALCSCHSVAVRPQAWLPINTDGLGRRPANLWVMDRQVPAQPQ